MSDREKVEKRRAALRQKLVNAKKAAVPRAAESKHVGKEAEEDLFCEAMVCQYGAYEGKTGPINLDLAQQKFQKLAELEHLPSIYSLGCFYQEVKKDEGSAKIWFEKAEKRAIAIKARRELTEDEQLVVSGIQLALANYYFRDSKDVSKAFHYYHALAEAGDRTVAVRVALMYQTNTGIPKNITPQQRIERAIKWYRFAAKTEAEAAHGLGMLYLQQSDRDKAEGLAQLEAAFEKGHLESAKNLARLYHLGEEGVSQDYHKAIKWYEKLIAAAKRFDPPKQPILSNAQCALALLLSQRDQPKDTAKIIPLLREAAADSKDFKNFWAQSSYGMQLWFRKDVACLKYLESAAGNGYPMAAYILARVWQEGLEGDTARIEKDETKGHYWLQRAIAQKVPIALFHYAIQCKDPKKAWEYYLRAAELNYREAQIYVAKQFEKNGDLERASQWMEKAIALGYIEGFSFIGAMLFKQGRYKEASSYFKKGAEQGNQRAQLAYAYCYRDGMGVEADEDKAVFWFAKAMQQGVIKSKFIIGFTQEDPLKATIDLAEGKSPAKISEEMADLEESGLLNAAIHGDLNAQKILGGFLYRAGPKKDAESAFRWVHEAAKQGDVMSLFLEGQDYYEGSGTDELPSDAKAVAAWRKVIQRDPNFLYALHNLGSMLYEGGDGVPRNREEGLALLQRSADAGFQESSLTLMKIRLVEANAATTVVEEVKESKESEEEISEELLPIIHGEERQLLEYLRDPETDPKKKQTIQQKVVEMLTLAIDELRQKSDEVNHMRESAEDPTAKQLMVGDYAIANATVRIFNLLRMLNASEANDAAFTQQISRGRDYFQHHANALLSIPDHVSPAHIAHLDSSLEMAEELSSYLTTWLSQIKNGKGVPIEWPDFTAVESPRLQEILAERTHSNANWQVQLEREKAFLLMSKGTGVPESLLADAADLSFQRYGVGLTHLRIVDPNRYVEGGASRDFLRREARRYRHRGLSGMAAARTVLHLGGLQQELLMQSSFTATPSLPVISLNSLMSFPPLDQRTPIRTVPPSGVSKLLGSSISAVTGGGEGPSASGELRSRGSSFGRA